MISSPYEMVQDLAKFGFHLVHLMLYGKLLIGIKDNKNSKMTTIID